MNMELAETLKKIQVYILKLEKVQTRNIEDINDQWMYKHNDTNIDDKFIDMDKRMIRSLNLNVKRV